MAELAGDLAAVGREIERVCRLLEAPSPENLDLCPPLLERACAGLAGLQPRLLDAGAEPDVKGQVRQLRSAACLAARLLENTRQYHERWHRLLAGLAGGYNRRGDPASMALPGRVCLTG